MKISLNNTALIRHLIYPSDIPSQKEFAKNLIKKGGQQQDIVFDDDNLPPASTKENISHTYQKRSKSIAGACESLCLD